MLKCIDRYQSGLVLGDRVCVSLPNTVVQVKEENLKELTARARMLIDKALKAASEYEGVVSIWIEVKWVLNKIKKKYWYPYLKGIGMGVQHQYT